MNWFKALKTWLRRWSGAEAETVAARVECQNLKAELAREQDKHADTRGLLGETIARADYERQKAQAEAMRPFPVVDGDKLPAWTDHEAQAWAGFLKTHTGQLLQQQANFYEQAANRGAILRTEGAENNTGFARGWHKATAYFFQGLSAPVPPQEDTDEHSSTGVAGLRERHTP